MWQYLQPPRTVPATRELALSFAQMTAAPNERKLKPDRLRAYAASMEAGAFRSVTWASALCAENGVTYRVNGQHTAKLVAEREPAPAVFVTLERYVCPTLLDVAQLWSTFDQKLAVRLPGEINASYAGAVDHLAGVPGYVLNAAVSGLGFAFDLEEYAHRPADARARRLSEHTAFVLWLAKLLSNGGPGCKGNDVGSSKPLTRLAVVAAMFRTWEASAYYAEEFWTEVRDETGTEPSAPSRVLAKFLRLPARSRGANRAFSFTNREVMVKCLHAWNAYCRQTGTLLKIYSNEVPKALRPQWDDGYEQELIAAEGRDLPCRPALTC